MDTKRGGGLWFRFASVLGTCNRETIIPHATAFQLVSNTRIFIYLKFNLLEKLTRGKYKV